MTTEVELEGARDMSAIQCSDIQQMHTTIGLDIVSEIQIPMNLTRVEVETNRALRLFTRLRQHAPRADNEDELRRVHEAKCERNHPCVMLHCGRRTTPA